MINIDKMYILRLKVNGHFCKVGKHLSGIVISPFVYVKYIYVMVGLRPTLTELQLTKTRIFEFTFM